MVGQTDNQESIWEDTRRILGTDPDPDFERVWSATVKSQTGAAALRLLSVEPPAYYVHYAGEMDTDGMMSLEQYTFGRHGVIASVVRTNASGFEVFKSGIEERLGAQLTTPAADPGPPDYARLAEILQQGPAAELPGAGQ